MYHVHARLQGCLMFLFPAFLHVLQINHPAFRKHVWPPHFPNSKTFLLPVLPYDQEKHHLSLPNVVLFIYHFHLTVCICCLSHICFFPPNFSSKHRRKRKKGHHNEIPHGNHDVSFFRLAFFQFAHHHSFRYACKYFSPTLQVFANSFQNFQNRNKHFR